MPPGFAQKPTLRTGRQRDQGQAQQSPPLGVGGGRAPLPVLGDIRHSWECCPTLWSHRASAPSACNILDVGWSGETRRWG